jgi:hypothetical protein
MEILWEFYFIKNMLQLLPVALPLELGVLHIWDLYSSKT